MQFYGIIGAGFGVLCLTSTAMAETVRADVWADNWFALYGNEDKVAEDSVSITTERSFNAESFSFEAERPYVLNWSLKTSKRTTLGWSILVPASSKWATVG